MRKILFVLLVYTVGLFAGSNDFLVDVLQQILAPTDKQEISGSQKSTSSKSLSEEETDKKAKEQREEVQKQSSIRQFNEKIFPRIKNLEVLNGLFYEKYLVKHTDKPEMIDEKFKQRQQLYAAMAKDYAALEREYRLLRETIDYGNYEQPGQSIDVPKPFFYSKENKEKFLEIRSGWEPFEPSKDNHFDIYENYLREAYKTYEARQKAAKEEKERGVANAKIKKDSEAKIKAIAAERKKVAPACQKWRSEISKQVYSLGIGDKIVSANGAVYTIAGVNANTFTVVSMINTYLHLQKNTCLPYDALKHAPSRLCYQ